MTRSRKINDFIRSSNGLDYRLRLDNRYSVLENYFPYMTDELDERFIQDPFYDFVNENLQSHDWRKLKERLLRKYGSYIWQIQEHPYTNHKLNMIQIDFASLEACEIVMNDTDFQNILDFFNYFVTRVISNIAILEPKYSEDASDYVYGECKGIIYHITDKDNVSDILEKGIRCKGNTSYKDGYRIFPKRTYFMAINPDERNPKVAVKEFMRDVFKNTEDFVALRINLRYTRIKCYKDLAMENYPDCYFTYTNIPAELIESVVCS